MILYNRLTILSSRDSDLLLLDQCEVVPNAERLIALDTSIVCWAQYIVVLHCIQMYENAICYRCNKPIIGSETAMPLGTKVFIMANSTQAYES